MPIRRQSGPLLPAKNERLVDTALKTVESLRERNKANVKNAIEATGYPVTIYNRLLGGRPCTCSQQSQALLDEQGNLSNSMIESLVTGQESGVTTYGNREKPGSVVDKDRNVEVVNSERPNQMKVFTVTGDGDQRDEINDLDWEESDERPAADAMEDEDRVYIGGSYSCGLCFGSRFVGGFSLLHGQRIILDASLDHRRELTTIDVLARPYAFNMLGLNCSVEFDLVAPAAVAFALAPRVFNNKRILDPNEYTLEGTNTGGTLWFELTAKTLMYLGTGLQSSVRLTPKVDGMAFTHIELVFSHLDAQHPFKADFPEINKSSSATMADVLSGTIIKIPGELVLNRGSIIIDHLPKLSRHWMLNTLTPRKDQFGYAYDCDADCRNMDLNELGQLLRPLVKSIYPIT